MISNLPVKGPFRLIDDKKKNEMAKKYLDEVGLNVEPTTRLGELSIAEQQQVEIAKALSLDAKILIFDEPTSSLTNRETRILFEIIRKLKAGGACIIYISHKSDEIFEICDKVTVLRNGENVGTLDTKAATNDELVSLIIGRKLEQYFPQLPPAPGEDAPKVLEVKDLVNRKLAGVSFSLRKGEILGLSKWFMTESKVLILDEPTRGVDVGAKAEIYELITEMVSKGLSVIMISCEESEMLGMCHRILVMRDGEIIGEFNREDATQEKLVGLCMGGKTV